LKKVITSFCFIFCSSVGAAVTVLGTLIVNVFFLTLHSVTVLGTLIVKDFYFYFTQCNRPGYSHSRGFLFFILHSVTVLGTLKALVQAGLVVSVVEEREKALEDLETRKRREEVFFLKNFTHWRI
jgi:hypothetical protein